MDKLEKIKAIAESVGIPCCYREFPKGVGAELPFLVYFDINSDNFAADNIAYIEFFSFSIELYTENRDLSLEHTVEQALSDNGIYWDKEVAYIDSEKCYQIAYEFEY